MATGLNPPEPPTGSESNDFDRVNLRQESERERHFHCEQLSAMMDGALSTDASRFLLRRMQHDADLAGCWERWQLYGDAMRGQTGNALPADFSRRIARAIAAEAEANRAAQSAAFEPVAATANGQTAAWRQRLRWGGGAALAASVAIAALISTRDLSQTGEPAPSAAVASTPTTAAANTPATTIVAASSPAPAAAPEVIVLSPDKIPRKMASLVAVSSDAPATQMSAPAAEAARVASVATDAGLRPHRDPRASQHAGVLRERHASALVAETPPAATSMGTDPFGRQAVDLSAKPWPRALLPEAAAVGGVTVDYDIGSSSVHPWFQPRVEAALAPAPTDPASPSNQSPSP